MGASTSVVADCARGRVVAPSPLSALAGPIGEVIVLARDVEHHAPRFGIIHLSCDGSRLFRAITPMSFIFQE
jgi:hypothetical protein